VANIKHFS